MARGQKIAVIWLLAVLLPALASANGVASRAPVSLSALAPADEYFGPLKMSPLGIRHKIFTLKDNLHHARAHPDSIEHDALMLEAALRDWFKRFPQDPWIPATAWNLATLYEELPGTDAQTRAVAQLHFVRDSFAGTQYAQYAAKDLTRGIGIRPWPHWAGAVPSTPRPTPSLQATPHQTATAAPTATAPPSPTVAATPNDAKSLVAVILEQKDVNSAIALEKRYWALSNDGTNEEYARAAWELAALYERLPGEESRQHAVRLLALLVDRYPNLVYGRWALRDLERGVGAR